MLEFSFKFVSEGGSKIIAVINFHVFVLRVWLKNESIWISCFNFQQSYTYEEYIW